MVLDRLDADPGAANAARWRKLAHLRGATVEAIARRRFTRDEADALEDLMMEHFAADGFLADTLIDFLSGRIEVE